MENKLEFIANEYTKLCSESCEITGKELYNQISKIEDCLDSIPNIYRGNYLIVEMLLKFKFKELFQPLKEEFIPKAESQHNSKIQYFDIIKSQQHNHYDIIYWIKKESKDEGYILATLPINPDVNFKKEARKILYDITKHHPKDSISLKNKKLKYTPIEWV